MKPLLIVLSLIALMAATGCGKKGPLEPPPSRSAALHQHG